MKEKGRESGRDKEKKRGSKVNARKKEIERTG